MTESWRPAKASEVVLGDVVRTQAGQVLKVSRIDSAFMGREGLLAFIEDTQERWYKQPVQTDAQLEILADH